VVPPSFVTRCTDGPLHIFVVVVVVPVRGPSSMIVAVVGRREASSRVEAVMRRREAHSHRIRKTCGSSVVEAQVELLGVLAAEGENLLMVVSQLLLQHRDLLVDRISPRWRFSPWSRGRVSRGRSPARSWFGATR
jgi:hypothetical protein